MRWSKSSPPKSGSPPVASTSKTPLCTSRMETSKVPPPRSNTMARPWKPWPRPYATAAAVGERLKRLAKDVQVLVVTHSPQVAAVADRHWLIRKTTTRSAASTDVLALDAKGRREEIARMLSGAEVTAEARAAADRLLAAR